MNDWMNEQPFASKFPTNASFLFKLDETYTNAMQ